MQADKRINKIMHYHKTSILNKNIYLLGIKIIFRCESIETKISS